MSIGIEAVLIGRVAKFTEGGELSAIAKSAVKGPQIVGMLGIEGDAQADRLVHGGSDKAIHHYPRDHYPAWQAELGQLDLLERVGAFGENISTSGLIENDVCIGDRFRLGTALVEIAQGRQPCWKQGHRLGDAGIIARMVKTRRCGWYYRVIEEGVVASGDEFALVDCPFPEWSVTKVIELLIGGGAKNDQPAVRYLAGMDVLATNWRKRAAELCKAFPTS